MGGDDPSTGFYTMAQLSHWNTYFAVTDTDAAAKKAEALGGAVLAPRPGYNA